MSANPPVYPASHTPDYCHPAFAGSGWWVAGSDVERIHVRAATEEGARKEYAAAVDRELARRKAACDA